LIAAAMRPQCWRGGDANEIKGIARVKFHPGKRDERKRLTEQAMEIGTAVTGLR
jgi:hypothetical protein